LLQEANAAFQGANAASHPDAAKPLYDKAILRYEKIIDQGGIQNAKLYYNLANAYLLKEDLGRAILNYRRAARVARASRPCSFFQGRDARATLPIRKNLAFARSRRVDKVETSAEKRVRETLFFWHYDFSLPTKSLLACLFFAALCTALTVTIWSGNSKSEARNPKPIPNPKDQTLAPSRGPFRISDFGPSSLFRISKFEIRNSSPAAAVLSAVLLVCLLTSILVETKREAQTRYGVITAAQVVARQGDGPNYPPSFKDPLHAGLEFELIEHRPGWWHIQLSDGADAWIPDDTAGLV
jgi:hypothetical protein